MSVFSIDVKIKIYHFGYVLFCFFQNGRSELFSSLLVYATFGTYIFIHLFLGIERTVKVNLLLRNTKQKKKQTKTKKKYNLHLISILTATFIR